MVNILEDIFSNKGAIEIVRALLKTKKGYTGREVAGIRFENCVAVHLLKYVYYINDLGLDELSLHYIRDKDKREVDFLICRKKKPFILIECKLTDEKPSKSLFHFSRLLRAQRAIQLIANPINPKTVGSKDITIDIVPAASFLKALI